MNVFEQKIRKIMYTPVNPILLYKSGVKGSQNYIGMFPCCVKECGTMYHELRKAEYQKEKVKIERQHIKDS